MSLDAERAARKDDHLRLALEQPERRNDFDDVAFVHHALAGIAVDEVSLATQLGAWQWRLPFYANGMTGGTARAARVNRAIAIAARETGIAMACGSMSVALDEPETAGSFTVIREENPDGFVMANLGIERSADDARRAVDLIQADALQIHINAVQEMAMPEGSRDFSGWTRQLERLLGASPVPVIVKEVGFGLSPATLSQLASLGVEVADVAGRGGTDFLAIENARASGAGLAVLSGFGQSAPACLLEAPADAPMLLASGGVRNALDVAKSLALGAHAVGVAGTFLRAVDGGGAQGLVDCIHAWVDQLTAMLTLLGAPSPAALRGTDVIVSGRLREYCELRGVDLTALAHRATTPRSTE